MFHRCVNPFLILTAVAAFALPAPAEDLKNDPSRIEAFMDWGLGIIVHWSMGSQLRCVISHSRATRPSGTRTHFDRGFRRNSLTTWTWVNASSNSIPLFFKLSTRVALSR